MRVRLRLTPSVRLCCTFAMRQNLTSPLRKARQAAGLSQSQLAGQLGVSKSAISAWEAGLEFPQAARLAGIERALYLFAHQRPWSYGLASVAIALAAGWAASVAFRRN